MDKRSLAIDCYIQALQKSVYLTEALDALVNHEMLMAWEERDLIQHVMPLQQHGNDADLKILKYLYESKLKKYYTVQSQVKDTFLIFFPRLMLDCHFRQITQRRHQTILSFSTVSMKRLRKVSYLRAANQSACQPQRLSKA
jgi:hypothetical protein